MDSPVSVCQKRYVVGQKGLVDANLRNVKGIGACKVSNSIDITVESVVRACGHMDAIHKLCWRKCVIHEQAGLADEFWDKDKLRKVRLYDQAEGFPEYVYIGEPVRIPGEFGSTLLSRTITVLILPEAIISILARASRSTS